MDRDTDVLIVGGGPAGLAAAIVCASHSLRTVLCDKRPLPADKPCGEGVMPTGLAHLERLGVKKYLLDKQYFPFEGICYFSSNGKIAQASFREGPGWGIPRLELSAALLQRASELKCLEIHTGVALPVGREETSGKPWIQVGQDRVSARLLIGAEGLNSTVRRWAGLQGTRNTHLRWGVRQHFRIPPWSKKVEVHWQAGAEAYVTPCGENLIGVAFLWDQQRHPRLPGGQKLVPALLRAFPTLATRLKDVPTADAPLAAGPMQRTAVSPIAESVLLIGDAAGYLDALTGEGISLALAQAIALEETVVPLLKQGPQDQRLSCAELAPYAKAYRSIMQPYYQVTKLALWLSHQPRLAEQTIGLLGRKPAIFQALLSANMGVIPLWQVPFAVV